jgi:glycosyltransferase involved in cell wall biosynthesis
MRLGLIAPGFSADEHDWAIPVLQNVVTALARVHDVHLVALRYPPGSSTYRLGDVKVRALGGGRTAGPGRVGLLLRGLAAVLGQARRQPFDVLHAFWGDEPGFTAAVAGRLLGVPTLVSLMGGELVGLAEIGYGGRLGRLNPLLTRAALTLADRVTIGSAYMQRLLAEQYPQQRCELLSWGVDTARFSPEQEKATGSPLHAGEIKLLQVAGLSPVKDHRTALLALRHVVASEPRAHLHLVGEGQAGPQVQSLAEELRLSGHVTLHGKVDHLALPAYYRAADLCLLSSRHEAQGMVVLEAAACGRPTAGTAVGLLPEMTPACVAVPVGDWLALAEAILAFVRDPDRLRRSSEAVRAFAVRRYSLSGCLAEIDSLYNSLRNPS